MSGKNILITGGRGMLASTLKKTLNLNNKIISLPREKLDISNIKSIKTVIKENMPDVIIHTAAFTDVEKCEREIDKTFLVNTLGTQNLVNCCLDKDIFFIYISSTGIYGNFKETPYIEFDYPNPTTIHHKSKFEAEKIIQNHLNKFLIIRTGWLFGGDINHKKNFVYKRFLEATKNKVVYSDNIQKGNPTFVKDLSKQIELLMNNQIYGIFNCVNKAKSITRYNYVKKIIELFGIDCDVKIAPKGFFKRIAPVSKNESAINYKLKLYDLDIMRKWDIALEEYINQLKNEI